MATTIDVTKALDNLRAEINAEMMKAAEPLIEKCMAEVREALRRRLAIMVVALINKSYDISGDRNRMTINVNLNGGDKERMDDQLCGTVGVNFSGQPTEILPAVMQIKTKCGRVLEDVGDFTKKPNDWRSFTFCPYCGRKMSK